MILFWLALVLLLQPPVSFAGPHANIEAEVTTASDANSQRRLHVSALKDRYEIGWPYAGEPEKGHAWGLSFDAASGGGPEFGGQNAGYSIQRPAILGRCKVSPKLSFDSEFGWTQFRGGVPSQDRADGTWGLKSRFRPFARSAFELGARRSTMMQEMAISGDLTDPTVFVAVEEAGSFDVTPYLQLRESMAQRWIDGGNGRFLGDVSLMYAFSKFPTWFWLGLGVNYISFAKRSATYWSPSKVMSYGPRFELSLPVSDRWQLKGGGGVYSLREEDFSASTGNYLRGGVQYGKRDEFNIEAYAVDIRSSRGSSTWSSSSFGLSLVAPF